MLSDGHLLTNSIYTEFTLNNSNIQNNAYFTKYKNKNKPLKPFISTLST